jgi:hypothetical protein
MRTLAMLNRATRPSLVLPAEEPHESIDLGAGKALANAAPKDPWKALNDHLVIALLSSGV